MASIVITRGTTLPDSGGKTDLHNLIDTATAAITNIVNADVSASAAIAGTKISPNFGSQNIVTTGTLTLTNAINEFSTDGTMGGNSDSAVPTEKAVVTYVGSTSVLLSKVYDSGWFAIVAGQTYAKTHSLGTTKLIGNVYVSQYNDNTGIVANAGVCNITGNDGAQMIALTSTSISIKIATDQTWAFEGSNFANGYARIILLALE